MARLLQVRNLTVSYFLGGKRIIGVEDAEFAVDEGEILGLVGESGSGKSTLAVTVVGALKPPGKVTGGSVLFQDKDILEMSDGELRGLRWKEISFVPQASQNALSPTMKVRDAFRGVMRAHGVRDAKRIKEIAESYLVEVMLDPVRVMDSYPHELSGGMKQRVLIALSLVLDPKLIILDEPTSALDLITQEIILELVKSVQRKLGVSMLFITHDLSLVSGFAHRTAVMYHGKIMEIGPTTDIMEYPINPYTRALLLAIPKLHGDARTVKPITGSPPSPTDSIQGCRFHPRCPYAERLCEEKDPPLEVVGRGGRLSACHFNSRFVERIVQEPDVA